jgi:hypothetical protein
MEGGVNGGPGFPHGRMPGIDFTFGIHAERRIRGSIDDFYGIRGIAFGGFYVVRTFH